MPDPPSTDSFAWNAGPHGCLLVHGLSGTPYEMRGVGERLHAAGYTVRGVRLAGHADDRRGLATCGWHDWYASLEEGLDALRQSCPTVAVVGLSLGSLLSLRLAHERPADVAALVLLSTPLVLARQRSARLAYAARRLLPVLPGGAPAVNKRGSDIADPVARASHPGTAAIPVRSIAELVALQRLVRGLLPRIAQPALALQGQHDPTAPVANLELLRPLPNLRRTVVLPRSQHVVTVDLDRDTVVGEILEFLAATVAATARHTHTEAER